MMYPALLHFREIYNADIPALAKICAKDEEPVEFWSARLQGYLRNEFNPYQALSKRVIFVATRMGVPIGFIAGHITKRSDYQGHVQWINVARQYQRMGIGSELLWILASWFEDQQITRVRADVDIDFVGTRYFLNHHKAQLQNKHWLCWEDIRTILPKD